jgi:hypothetical protein
MNFLALQIHPIKIICNIPVESRVHPDFTQTKVIVVGDSEFGAVGVQKMLKLWHWKYVLRKKGFYFFKAKGQSCFKRLDSLVTKPGQKV